MTTNRTEAFQKAISREGVAGWLFYDFQGSDPLARRILNIPSGAHMTRRWFYFVPKSGAPVKLMHRIESHALDHLPGESQLYAGWRELRQRLENLFPKGAKVAMHYSPGNEIPYVSRVDAGTVELVREAGATVVSAADLIQEFEAVATREQLDSHVRAAKALREIVDLTFGYVAKEVTSGKKLSEYDVQEFIWQEFSRRKMVSDYRPIAAVGSHSGDPHYEPKKDSSFPVKKDDFLLIDLWAKETIPDAIYADITWTGYLGKNVPAKHKEIFDVVAGGRDAALRFVEEGIRAKRVIRGREVDDAARNYITQKGYGDYFIHRTGHNIGLNVHGNGANMDNFETREERKLLVNTCFSIEPGVYLPEFGVRSEIDVFVHEDRAEVYGLPIQREVVAILK